MDPVRLHRVVAGGIRYTYRGDELTHGDVERPFLLFAYDDTTRRWSVTAQAAAILHRVPSKVTRVVGIAGPMREGKSYLMNRLAGVQRGFALGPYVTSATKGLWAWLPPSLNRPGDAEATMLVDTEGLCDPERADRGFDAQVFMLATLLSSVLIYNFKSVLNEDSIGRLAFVVEITRTIAGAVRGVPSADAAHDLFAKMCFPSLLFVSRDAFLKLQDDCPSYNEFLRRTLAPRTAAAGATEAAKAQVETSNNIRATLRAAFPVMEYHVISRPVDDEELLAYVDELPEDGLRPAFLAQVNVVVDSVMRHLREQRARGGADVRTASQRLTPALLLQFAQQCCDAFNDSKRIDTVAMLYSATAVLDERAMAAAIAHADAVRVGIVAGMPMSVGDVKLYTSDAVRGCGCVFREARACGVAPEPELQRRLLARLQVWSKEVETANAQKLVQQCEQLLCEGMEQLYTCITTSSYGSVAEVSDEPVVIQMQSAIDFWARAGVVGCSRQAEVARSGLQQLLHVARRRVDALISSDATMAAQLLAEERAVMAADADASHALIIALQAEERDELAADIAAMAERAERERAEAAEAATRARVAGDAAAAAARDAHATRMRETLEQNQAAMRDAAAAATRQLEEQRAANAAELARMR